MIFSVKRGVLKLVLKRVLSCCLLPTSLLLSWVSQASNQDEVVLSLKPQACIVQRLGEPCQLSVTAVWHAPKAMNLCLVTPDRQLACWRNVSSGSKKFSIALLESTKFSLVDNDQNTVAVIDVIINAATPPNYRRRLRSDWSVF